MQTEIIVLKFGSSVLVTRADLPNAVHEIYRWYRSGYKVVAVVSAIGLTTDELLCEARSLAPNPESYATAELLSTGERTSAALLGIALDRAGVRARVLSPQEVNLVALGGALDSELRSLNYGRVHQLLGEYPVLVIPGFFGTDTEGRTHVLGRGGSDLTAVFLAQALKARCRLLKDVDGVYEVDPAEAEQEVPQEALRRFARLSYADGLSVAGQLLQPKAISFLRQYSGRAEVAACAQGYETVVQSGSSEFACPQTAQPPPELSEPSRILLLGLGTVGFGVYQRLSANAAHFQVVGVLIRDRGKHERSGIPAGLLRTRAEQVMNLRADLVVDTLSDAERSRELAEYFIGGGVGFITASKTLIAESGASLTGLAERSGARLLYRAAVGGASPMLEATERCSQAHPILALAGVLNGTCNFVLDRCRDGLPLAEALTEARREGFAEADPRDDLEGLDAARKLSILCRHAFGAEARLVEIQRLDEAAVQRARELTAHGLRLRQVARASICAGEVTSTVRLEAVPEGSPFAQLREEWNGLQIVTTDRLVWVSGRGAGRWPTTEAIVADLFEARRLGTALTDANRRLKYRAPGQSLPRSD